MATIHKTETDSELSKFFLKLVAAREIVDLIQTIDQNISYKHRIVVPRFICGMEIILYDAELFGIKSPKITLEILTAFGCGNTKRIVVLVESITIEERMSTDNDPEIGHLHYDYSKETKYTLPRYNREKPIKGGK